MSGFRLVDSIRSGAQAAFIMGLVMMICAPLAVIMGVLSGLLGRRR